MPIEEAIRESGRTSRYLTMFAAIVMSLKSKTSYDANGRAEYQGYAEPGTSSASPSWLIKKFTYDINGRQTDAEFAGGSAKFNSIWDNRAALSYS